MIKKKNQSTEAVHEDLRCPTRRAFLSRGVLVVGAAGFSFRGVLAQARQARKPAFTAATVNRLAANSSTEKYRELFGREAQVDLKAFVRRTFYLTAEQEKELNDLTAEQVSQIQTFLKRTLNQKTRLKIAVSYGPPLKKTRGESISVSLPVRSALKDSPESEKPSGKQILFGTIFGR